MSARANFVCLDSVPGALCLHQMLVARAYVTMFRWLRNNACLCEHVLLTVLNILHNGAAPPCGTYTELLRCRVKVRRLVTPDTMLILFKQTRSLHAHEACMRMHTARTRTATRQLCLPLTHWAALHRQRPSSASALQIAAARPQGTPRAAPACRKVPTTLSSARPARSQVAVAPAPPACLHICGARSGSSAYRHVGGRSMQSRKRRADRRRRGRRAAGCRRRGDRLHGRTRHRRMVGGSARCRAAAGAASARIGHSRRLGDQHSARLKVSRIHMGDSLQRLRRAGLCKVCGKRLQGRCLGCRASAGRRRRGRGSWRSRGRRHGVDDRDRQHGAGRRRRGRGRGGRSRGCLSSVGRISSRGLQCCPPVVAELLRPRSSARALTSVSQRGCADRPPRLHDYSARPHAAWAKWRCELPFLGECQTGALYSPGNAT